jgi:hypothetical protein
MRQGDLHCDWWWAAQWGSCKKAAKRTGSVILNPREQDQQKKEAGEGDSERQLVVA